MTAERQGIGLSQVWDPLIPYTIKSAQPEHYTHNNNNKKDA